MVKILSNHAFLLLDYLLTLRSSIFRNLNLILSFPWSLLYLFTILLLFVEALDKRLSVKRVFVNIFLFTAHLLLVFTMTFM